MLGHKRPSQLTPIGGYFAWLGPDTTLPWEHRGPLGSFDSSTNLLDD
jgi:hypothetical protein